MRIENNSNLAFKAYFKNNTIFKRLYSGLNAPINKELVDTFTKKCPNHEIEIISSVEDAFRPIAGYTLFNNNTGGSCYFTINKNSYNTSIIEECMKACINIPVKSYSGNFWGTNQKEETYKALTNPNDR